LIRGEGVALSLAFIDIGPLAVAGFPEGGAAETLAESDVAWAATVPTG